MNKKLKFIDLFAGIGGFRLAFDELNCECIFSCEIDKFCRKTYLENFNEFPNGDIKNIVANQIPDHEILLAGFPCQPFSLAGKQEGFSCDKGNLFFEIKRILDEKKTPVFLLENVKNLMSHDKGRTFSVIKQNLEEEYYIFYKILSAENYVPQKRKRIFIVGFRKEKFKYEDISKFEFPQKEKQELKIENILEKNVKEKYTLSDKVWNFLQFHAENHKSKGNGFGYGLIDIEKGDQIARTLTARYYKDGSEILIKQENKNPRRLIPRECARLMGFPDTFKISVSDNQAYKQFGNSVVVPLVKDIGKNLLFIKDLL